MSSYTIVSIDEDTQTMIIDWGENLILNHFIPLYIIEHPELTDEEKDDHISRMRPK